MPRRWLPPPYASGYSSYLEVTDVREKLFAAQLARIQAQVDVLTGVAGRLYKSLGGGWSAVPAAVRDAGLVGEAKATKSALHSGTGPQSFKRSAR